MRAAQRAHQTAGPKAAQKVGQSAPLVAVLWAYWRADQRAQQMAHLMAGPKAAQKVGQSAGPKAVLWACWRAHQKAALKVALKD